MSGHVDPELEAVAGEKLRRVSVFGRDIVLPRSRLLRIGLGGILVLLGCFGFLPVLGFWMIPLGLLILSYEYAGLRRWRRNMAVKLGRRRRGGGSRRMDAQ